MKKVKYKATNVNQLDWKKLRQKFQNQPIIFSVDVAKNDFVGLLTTQDQNVVQLVKWTHPQDTRAFIEHLCHDLGTADLTVAIEPTGTYGDALRWQFVQRNIPVYRVNPKHTYDQAESFDGVPSSHDAKSACIIADLHVRGRSQVWQEQSIEQRDLRGLSNELETHQKVHRANVNRLSALMARHWPELETVMDLKSVSVLSLLAEYGDPNAVVHDQEAAFALLHRVGRAGLKTEKKQAIIDSAQQTLGVPCTPGERVHIRQLATDLLRTHRASAAVEKKMVGALSERKDLTEVVKLCGNVTSVVLIALLGDLRQYSNANSLLNAMGLTLKERSSGKHKGRLKITKRGSSRVRFYLYWLVLRLIKQDAHIKAWFERKVKRDGRRSKKCAIIAIMRKVAKALWYVARGEAFDSRKLFACEGV